MFDGRWLAVVGCCARAGVNVVGERGLFFVCTYDCSVLRRLLLLLARARPVGAVWREPRPLERGRD